MKGLRNLYGKNKILAAGIMAAALAVSTAFSGTAQFTVYAEEAVTGSNAEEIVEQTQGEQGTDDTNESGENVSDNSTESGSDVTQPEGGEETPSNSSGECAGFRSMSAGNGLPVQEYVEGGGLASDAGNSGSGNSDYSNNTNSTDNATTESTGIPVTNASDTGSTVPVTEPERERPASEPETPAPETEEPEEEAISLGILVAQGKTPDGQLIYDAKEQSVIGYADVREITGEDGETISVVAAQDVDTTYLVAGMPEVVFKAKDAGKASDIFVSGSGLTVYNIEGKRLKLAEDFPGVNVVSNMTIAKRPLKLQSLNLVKTYDGKPLSNGDLGLEVNEGWADGEGADFVFTKSRTQIGTEFNDFDVVPHEGTNLANYEISKKLGGITVLERLDFQKYILTVTGIDKTEKYNGEEQSASGFLLEGRSDTDYKVMGSGDPEETLSFSIGDAQFTVTGIAATASGKDAGTYPLSISGSPVVKDAEGNDVSSEFKFEYVVGSFTIAPREVTLTSGSAKAKYNGKYLTNEEVEVTGDGFVEGEGATYKVTGKQKVVGVSYNYFTYELNEGTQKKNYNIEVVPGKLQVTKADDTAINEEEKDDNKTDNQNSNPSNVESSDTDSSSDTTSAAKPAQSSDGPAVLGARKSRETTAEDDNTPKVLGARRSETGDNTPLTSRVAVILIAGAALAITIITKGKTRKND